jgi:hypothetical protein
MLDKFMGILKFHTNRIVQRHNTTLGMSNYRDAEACFHATKGVHVEI